MREGTPIGVIILWRKQVRPFTEKQIELVTTFADQAVIAIENVRLFDEVQARTRELTEALEQQTATSEVLQVISARPASWSQCSRPCWRTPRASASANFGNLFLCDKEAFRAVAMHNAPPAYAEARMREPNSPGTGHGAWPPCPNQADGSDLRPEGGTGLHRRATHFSWAVSNSAASGRYSPCQCSRKAS